ncbi:MAG: phage/plasmid primase, P4 family [Dehalococcoidia bacterium]
MNNEINTTEFYDMLHTMFRGQEGFVAFWEGRRAPGSKNMTPVRTRFIHNSDMSEESLEGLLQDVPAEHELYVAPLLYSDKKRDKAHALPLACLYVDGDGALIPPEVPHPDIVLETSPGRHHYIWPLAEVVEPEHGQGLNERLAAMIGADPSGGDLAQLIRIPGTRNHKYPDSPIVTLERHVEDYVDARILDELLPPLAERKRRIPRKERTSTLGEPPVRLEGEALKLWYGESARLTNEGSVDRSATLAAIASALAKGGASAELIVLALEDRDVELGFNKYCNRADANERYDEIAEWAVTNVAGSVVTRPLTDIGNAERLVDRHGDDVKYTPGRHWLAWEGRRFAEDESAARRFAIETARSISAEAATAPEHLRERIRRHAAASEGSARIDAQLKLAKDMEAIRRFDSDFDANPMLLNLLNGTLNLGTGKLEPHRRNDLLTKLAPVEWDATARCPTWRRFLRTIFDGDDELIRYIQRVAGYCLSGSCQEQVFFIFIGAGANGKTTLLRTWQSILGEYAQQMPAEALLRRQPGGARSDIARLEGCRLAVGSELNPGESLDEALIKQLTGNDPIVARRLYRDYVSFEPTFKLILATNNPPRVRGTDEGIWRRIQVVPFGVSIPGDDRDPNLLDKLLAESAGILRWMVRGALEWQEHGLLPPQAVIDAMNELREEEDEFAIFLRQCCRESSADRVYASELLTAYTDWADIHDATALGTKGLKREMKRHGCTHGRDNKGSYYKGLRLVVKGRALRYTA